MTPEALVFDLFGTLVFFDDSRVPTAEIDGRRVPMTIAGLPELLAEHLPGVPLSRFVARLRETGAELFARKRREGIELPTAVRFEITLGALGATPDAVRAGAAEMAARHMDTLARSVVCPPRRRALLESLAGEHRLGLLSNFDDGATARRVLAEGGLDRFFDVIVVSEEEGIRKPVRAIFERTCARLGLAPAGCVYVGDTLVEDVHGAKEAGLVPVWIRNGAPAEESPAVAVLPDVEELPAWLRTLSRGAART